MPHPPPPYLSIVLPAYNEARAIRGTLTAMRAFLDAQPYSYEVIVVAQGDDGTAGIVADAAAGWPALRLTAVAGRRGKGHALRTGMALVRGELVGFIDADYKTPIDEVVKLLPWLDRGYALAIGSRALPDSLVEVRQPGYRQVGSRAFALVLRLIVGLWHVRDTQCGFKFFTTRAARDIFGRARIDGYMTDIEILWLASRLGLPVKEVGVRWRDDRDSRLRLARDTVLNARDLFRIRFGRYRLPSSDNPVPAAAPAPPPLETR